METTDATVILTVPADRLEDPRVADATKRLQALLLGAPEPGPMDICDHCGEYLKDCAGHSPEPEGAGAREDIERIVSECCGGDLPNGLVNRLVDLFAAGRRAAGGEAREPEGDTLLRCSCCGDPLASHAAGGGACSECECEAWEAP